VPVTLDEFGAVLSKLGATARLFPKKSRIASYLILQFRRMIKLRSADILLKMAVRLFI